MSDTATKKLRVEVIEMLIAGLLLLGLLGFCDHYEPPKEEYHDPYNWKGGATSTPTREDIEIAAKIIYPPSKDYNPDNVQDRKIIERELKDLYGVE